MPGRRSEAAQVARKLVMNVRLREMQVALREARVAKREKIAPVVNQLALNVSHAQDNTFAAPLGPARYHQFSLDPFSLST